MESIFFHIDVNSAFLSWTAIDQLQKAKETDTLDSYVDLRDIPSIIGGDSATRHGIVLAKSIPCQEIWYLHCRAHSICPEEVSFSCHCFTRSSFLLRAQSRTYGISLRLLSCD